MKYNGISAEIVKALEEIAGSDYVIIGEDRTAAYLFDEVEMTYRPDAAAGSVVVKPKDTAETAAVMKLANENAVAVVVRGGATGLAGRLYAGWWTVSLSPWNG